MIFGVGIDIAKVSRFERWISNENLIDRYFAEGEKFSFGKTGSSAIACRHYASRFAAKEAFVKALGTGFADFELKDFQVCKTSAGKPFFKIGEKTQKKIAERIGEKTAVHLSISHEKEYAVAFVVIEVIEKNADNFISE